MVRLKASAGGKSKPADTSGDAGFEPAYMKLLVAGELRSARGAPRSTSPTVICAPAIAMSIDAVDPRRGLPDG